MNKHINSITGIILIVIIAGVAIVSIYLPIATTTKSKPLNKITEKTRPEKIAVGSACDARELKSYKGDGNIENTEGLQCYMYDDLSARVLNKGKLIDSKKEIARKGVWLYPNFSSAPSFLAPKNQSLFDVVSLNDVTKNWKSFKNSTGDYSLKIPQEWNANIDKSNPNIVTVEKNNTNEPSTVLLTITNFPNTNFENSDDYSQIKEIPDDLLTPDVSSNTFVKTRHFELNGNTALFVSRMTNYDLGGTSFDETVYINKNNSYFKITYKKYQNINLDLPVEMIIKSVQLK